MLLLCENIHSSLEISYNVDPTYTSRSPSVSTPFYIHKILCSQFFFKTHQLQFVLPIYTSVYGHPRERRLDLDSDVGQRESSSAKGAYH